MTDCADCGDNEPVTSEDAASLAFDSLADAREEALGGRATEAAMLNQTAQLALQLAHSLANQAVINPIATGTIQ